MDNVLDLLLKAEIPNAPEKQLKQKRLSEICGEDVIFTIRALTYSQETDIESLHPGDETKVFIVLAGVKSPDLKSKELMEKYKADTPAELIKTMFLPGEIVDLSREVEKISGFRISTLEEVKKK